MYSYSVYGGEVIGGLRQINTCRQVPQVPILVNFGVFIDIWSMARGHEQMISIGGMFKQAFVKRDKKRTMIDPQGIPIN